MKPSNPPGINKFQAVVCWKCSRRGSVAEITALNRIRRQHPALHSHLGLVFYPAYNDQVILYGKTDPLDGSMVLVAVSLDPHIAQQAAI